ncbi:hypothetical protein HYALB_00003640 [Hymenoscyphus albidus]|uniref:TEA domain-containing protein n=1 Tax=Hymenoscyphus albidus TaxID=595503 RepID=A0A9N9LW23_9HELO|nr:hypothetical protein HYALB_00003640 [Hymenoscyphus albidus]
MARTQYSWMVPSNDSNQLSLDDHSEYSQLASRQPLTESHGNSQEHSFAPVGLHHDDKDYPQQSEGHNVDPFRIVLDINCHDCEPCLTGRYNSCEKPVISNFLNRPTNPICPTPTVPSLPPHQSLGQTCEQRRERTRRRRQRKYQRNPIVESEHYQAYRARQVRDGHKQDAKWPHQLEMAFLDALLYIPPMGRRKFSYQGKPHGRNELIKEYLWISYLESLAPGEVPDETMKRTRKQVSSHIQVLKTFFKDHPACKLNDRQLFPESKDPKNGFHESFKNDPCLKALSEGRLPGKRYDDYDEISQSSVKPALFWLLITSEPVPAGSEQDLYCSHSESVLHKYTTLQGQRPGDSIESLLNWRQRYPYFENTYLTALRSSLPCEVIHMDVPLSLMSIHPPNGSELVAWTEISVSGNNRTLEQSSMWQSVTALSKPQALCRDNEPAVERRGSLLQVLSTSPQETRCKLPFPAQPWAQAFTSLANISEQTSSSPETIQALLNEVSMFQEVQYSPESGMPFITRALILWTFRQPREGESSSTTWRYLDCQELARRKCMSPDPGQGQRMNALMSQNFNSLIDNTHGLSGQQQNILDPFIQHHNSAHQNTGLATPPATAGLNSPFGSQQTSFTFGAFSQPQSGFDIPSENLSFASVTTVDSESTLVGSEGANIDSFLANNGLAGFDGTQLSHQSNAWNVTEGYDHDPTWAYAHLPTNETTQLECWQDLGDNAKPSQGWGEEGNIEIEDTQVWSGVTEGGVVERVKELEWVVEAPGHADSGWTDQDQAGSDGGDDGQEDNSNTGFEDWDEIQDIQEHDAMPGVGAVNNDDGFGDHPVLKHEPSIGAGWENVEVDDFDYSRLEELK